MYFIYKRKNYKSFKTLSIYIIIILLLSFYLFQVRHNFRNKEVNIFYLILLLKVLELIIYKVEKPNL